MSYGMFYKCNNEQMLNKVNATCIKSFQYIEKCVKSLT